MTTKKIQDVIDAWIKYHVDSFQASQSRNKYYNIKGKLSDSEKLQLINVLDSPWYELRTFVTLNELTKDELIGVIKNMGGSLYTDILNAALIQISRFTDADE